MRFALIVLASVLFNACATSIEEQEREALRSGDWTALEAHYRRLEQREARRRQRCPPGNVRLCSTDWGPGHCSCVPKWELEDRY